MNASLPLLLAELTAELCSIGHCDGIDDLDDMTRARLLDDVAGGMRLSGRRVHLRSAVAFARNAAEALAAGCLDEADRWETYARNDLDVYREQPTADHAAALEVSL